jgi:hypothetical protein
MENGKAPTSLAPSPLAAEDYRSPKAGACPLIPRFREASWSAAAERSGDTAFAPPMPLRQRPSRRNPNQLNPAFNASRFNDSTIRGSHTSRRKAPFQSPVPGLRSPGQCCLRERPAPLFPLPPTTHNRDEDRRWRMANGGEWQAASAPLALRPCAPRKMGFACAVRPGTPQRKSLKNL